MEKQIESPVSTTLDSKTGRRNVYISFHFDDLREVNLLRAQAKNTVTELKFIDRSIHLPIDTKNENKIKKNISRHISCVSVTLIYVSDKTHESDWVEWEARESLALKKGLLAFHKGNTPPKKIPSWLKELEIELLPWSHEKLNSAIEQAARDRN